MSRVRWVLAWAFWSVGHVTYLIFDNWLPFIGLRGPLYWLYNRSMGLSCDIQGPGNRGPWGFDTSKVLDDHHQKRLAKGRVLDTFDW